MSLFLLAQVDFENYSPPLVEVWDGKAYVTKSKAERALKVLQEIPKYKNDSTVQNLIVIDGDRYYLGWDDI